ncbi:hypothetical protein EB73_40205 [Mycobacterium sp. SWH-M3]|nr:hypothetical protein EB73_40205 [Mycobacterium sp. SWH-M3]
MKKSAFVALGATALASTAFAFGGTAAAAPTQQSVDQTVKSLETSGYHVIVNRTGAAPLSSCTVAGVRPGQTHVTEDSRGGGSINATVISKTVYVDVLC